MRSEREIRDLLESVLERTDADEAQAEYRFSRELSTRFGENAITQNSAGEEESVSLELACGNRHGRSTDNALDDSHLRKLVERAERIAGASPEDPEYVPPLNPVDYCDTPPRYYESTARLGPAEVAEDVESVLEPVSEAGYRASGLFARGVGARAVANTRGLFAYERSTGLDCSTTVHGPAGSGSAIGFSETAGRISAEEVGTEALETAIAAQKPRPIEPGNYAVIFEPRATFDLLTFMLAEMDARDADEGTSAFAGRRGEKLFSDRITITTEVDDPALPAPRFGEDGLPVRPRTWVADGTLERLRYSRYWARVKGEEPDPYDSPLTMHGEDRDVSDLIAACGRGLLVKRLWYIRFVDRRELLLTGMTRDGLFLVKDGKVAGPVQNLRFNESPINFLQRAVTLSRSHRIGPRAMMPGVLSEGFTFSSTTESV
jgi:predicted Zn-dependent protease